MARNPLAVFEPRDPDNPLAAGAPTAADAMDFNARAVADYVAQQRAQAAARGLWNPQTGLPTAAGWADAAVQYANALMMGTTAPVAPKLFTAMRLGRDRIVGEPGETHSQLWAKNPDMGNHPESELGFVNPAGRWLTRQQAFNYALKNDLIQPSRAAEAANFKQAMEEAGNTRNLFLPSEWLKKLGILGTAAGGAAAGSDPQQ